jgi:hypothetical protein
MKLKRLTAGHVSLTLSRQELGTMGNSLNEVCNGIRVVDFESKMGGKRNEVEQILDNIIPVYRKMKQSKSSSVTVRFSDYELSAIIGALTTVSREIDEIEFYTRMGAELSEVEQILDQMTPIYHKMKQQQ